MRQCKKPGDRKLVPYMSVWPELGVVDDLVCSGDRLVVPSAELGKDQGPGWQILHMTATTGRTQ